MAVLLVIVVVVAVGMARHKSADANKFDTDQFVCETADNC